MRQAEETAHKLSMLKDVKGIYSGTFVRVVQTATEVCEALGMELQPMEEFNDWDTGDWAGMLVSEIKPDLHDRIQHPLKKVPGGQTFQSWLDTITPALADKIEEDDLSIVISSGRVATLIHALGKGKGKEPELSILLGKPPIDPAGVMIVNSDWSIEFKTAKAEESKGMS